MRTPAARARAVRGLATATALAVSAVAMPVPAQQPKFPVPLPVPRAPAAQAEPARPAPRAPAAQSAPTKPAPRAPAGPRDPFEPLVKKAGPGATGEEATGELAGLKLVGVVWEPDAGDQVRALVETADGLGYALKVNDQKFGGTVVAIERDRVQFAVRQAVPGGAPRARTVDLRLPKPDVR